jgi:hypothetical protein
LRERLNYRSPGFGGAISMKAFSAGIIVAMAISVSAAVGLGFVQETVAQAYSTGADRLDQQERVNLYGR